jgi:hypothetical protein
VIRAQYHFRQSSRGLLAWDVRRLVALARGLPIGRIPVHGIAELDELHWFSAEDSKPTCRAVVEHCRLISSADLSYPIILDNSGRVMDGMHRVCKAFLQGIDTVAAVQFDVDPEPDYVGRDPDSLPYDDAE